MNKEKVSKIMGWCLTLLTLLIIIAGCVLRYNYAEAVPFHISPHDLGGLSDWTNIRDGHLGYVQYMYQYKQLPDFTPIGNRQFYHPPLFYIVGAYVFELFYPTLMDILAVFEILQHVNMAFASISVIYIYLITRKTIKSKFIRLAVTGFFSFSSMFYIIGTELNNDCLMTMFCIMAVYHTICWYQNSKLLNIIPIALSIGFGMLSKTSAVLIAPAVACVFLYTLIKKKDQWKKLFIQFFIFGMICIPIGMSWVVRNYIMFDVPFNYVLELSEDSNQYLGNIPNEDRFGLPSEEQLSVYTTNWNELDLSLHCNLWANMITTMSFDEGILNIELPEHQEMAVYLNKGTALLMLLAALAIIKLVFTANADAGSRIMFPLGFLVIMYSYIQFSIQFPHICTMSFRYIVTAVSCAVIGLGIAIDNMKHLKKTSALAVSIMVTGLSVISALLYYSCAV